MFSGTFKSRKLEKCFPIFKCRLCDLSHCCQLKMIKFSKYIGFFRYLLSIASCLIVDWSCIKYQEIEVMVFFVNPMGAQQDRIMIKVIVSALCSNLADCEWGEKSLQEKKQVPLFQICGYKYFNFCKFSSKRTRKHQVG